MLVGCLKLKAACQRLPVQTCITVDRQVWMLLVRHALADMPLQWTQYPSIAATVSRAQKEEKERTCYLESCGRQNPDKPDKQAAMADNTCFARW